MMAAFWADGVVFLQIALKKHSLAGRAGGAELLRDIRFIRMQVGGEPFQLVAAF